MRCRGKLPLSGDSGPHEVSKKSLFRHCRFFVCLISSYHSPNSIQITIIFSRKYEKISHLTLEHFAFFCLRGSFSLSVVTERRQFNRNSSSIALQQKAAIFFFYEKTFFRGCSRRKKFISEEELLLSDQELRDLERKTSRQKRAPLISP
jgi:hypothetical protein